MGGAGEDPSLPVLWAWALVSSVFPLIPPPRPSRAQAHAPSLDLLPDEGDEMGRFYHIPWNAHYPHLRGPAPPLILSLFPPPPAPAMMEGRRVGELVDYQDVTAGGDTRVSLTRWFWKPCVCKNLQGAS